MALPSWLQLSADSGSGDTQITITASSYSEFYERAHTLVVSGHTKHVNVQIYQDPIENTISISPSSHNYSYNGGPYQFTINSNSSWHITSSPSWITFNTSSGAAGTTTITATADINFATTGRSATIIVSGATASASTTVSQDEGVGPYLYISPTSITQSYSAGVRRVSVTTNGHWTIVSSPWWIDSVSPTTGDNQTSGFDITFNQNTGSVIRNGTIVVRLNETGEDHNVVLQQSYESTSATAYLTFNIISGGTIGWTSYEYEPLLGGGSQRDIIYRINNGPWTEIRSTSAGTTFNVNAGDIVEFYSETGTAGSTFGPRNTGLTSPTTAKFSVSGSISALYNFASVSPLSIEKLFYGVTGLTDASGLYFNPDQPIIAGAMFSGCTSLVTPPVLPTAEIVGSRTYAYMFYGCTALTTAPALQATKLATEAYMFMFYGCTSLTTAPELPATELKPSCYAGMFEGCTSLVNPPSILPANILVYQCYHTMFSGCTSLRTSPVILGTKISNARVDGYGSLAMCGMFLNCSSLSAITCMIKDIPSDVYQPMINWVSGVSSTGVYTKKDDSTISGPTGWTVETEPYTPGPDPADPDPLTITVESDGVLSYRTVNSSTGKFEYQLNNNPWISVSGSSVETTINVVTGDIVRFRADKDEGFTPGDYFNVNYGFHASTCRFRVAGVISTFCTGSHLFWKCTTLTDASGLICDSVVYSYDYMFQGCTSLVRPPQIPAIKHMTDKPSYRDFTEYEYMFANCSSLISTPELPADILVSKCYNSMFSGCASLTEAPAIPIRCITLGASACCASMFFDCSSLVSCGQLIKTIPGVTTLPVLTRNCFTSMFGWSGLATAPALPFEKLGENCYQSMFYGTSITTAQALPATTLADGCYRSMFQGCTSLRNAPTLPAQYIPYGAYVQMFSGCTSLSAVTCLATSTYSTGTTKNWLSKVSSSGTFTKDPNATFWTRGVNGIPSSWTVVDAT